MFCSCSSDMDNNLPQKSTYDNEACIKQESLVMLQGKIASLNDSMSVNQVKTRGLGNFLRRLWHTVSADAVGALFGNLWGGPIGAVTGAAACSGGCQFLKMEYTRSAENNGHLGDMNSDLSGLIPLNEKVEDNTLLDSIGYYHNKALLGLNDKNELSVSAMPVLLLDEVKAEVPQKVVFTDQDSIQLNKTYKKFVDNERTFKGNNVDEYESHLVECNPEQSGEIKVLFEFLRGLSAINIDDDNAYMQKVLQLIKEANLSETVKQNLRNGIIVGNASSKLWNVTEDE